MSIRLSEAAVGGVSGLVRNLHEGCACVQIDTVVGAEPGPMAVGDRREHRADEFARAYEDRPLRLWVHHENELTPVVGVDTSISTVDNLHDRVALQIRADHAGRGARSVEPWNPCAVHKAEPIDLVGLNFDAAEWIRVGRVHGPDPEGSVARAGLDVGQAGERLNDPRGGIHERNAIAHLVVGVEINAFGGVIEHVVAYVPSAGRSVEYMVGAGRDIDHVHSWPVRLIGPEFSIGVVLSVWGNCLPLNGKPSRERAVVVKAPLVSECLGLRIDEHRAGGKADERALFVRRHDRQPAGEADCNQWQIRGGRAGRRRRAFLRRWALYGDRRRTGRRLGRRLCRLAARHHQNREQDWESSHGWLEAAVGWISRLVRDLLQTAGIGVEVDPLRTAKPDPMRIGDRPVQGHHERAFENRALRTLVERYQKLCPCFSAVRGHDQRPAAGVKPNDEETYSFSIDPDDPMARCKVEPDDLVRPKTYRRLLWVGVGWIYLTNPEDAATRACLRIETCGAGRRRSCICGLAHRSGCRVDEPQPMQALETKRHVNAVGGVIEDIVGADRTQRERALIAADDVDDVEHVVCGVGVGIVGAVGRHQLPRYGQPAVEGALEVSAASPVVSMAIEAAGKVRKAPWRKKSGDPSY